MKTLRPWQLLVQAAAGWVNRNRNQFIESGCDRPTVSSVVLWPRLGFECSIDQASKIRIRKPRNLLVRWDPDNTQDDLTILNDGRTLAWRRDSAAAWLGSQTTARLAGGTYSWDFVIEDIGDRQIGVGIMLDPPDWGFFRYLGAGRNAWAYDAPAIQLPAGATVIPAACLLKKGQIVTIANFHRTA